MTRRLVLSTVALTTIVLVVLVVPLGLTSAEQARERLTLDLERDAVAMASLVEDRMETGRRLGSLQAVADNYREQTGVRTVIVDRDGVSLADSDPARPVGRDFSSRPELASALDGQVASGSRRSDTLDTTLLYVAVPVASAGTVYGAIRVSFSDRDVNEVIRDRWLTLGLVSVLALAAATGLGWALGRSVVLPLSRLQAAATDLGGGDLSARAETEAGPPEVRALGSAFNDMADRLERLVGAQEAFVADASHQLRTPLTALLLRLENLGEAPGVDADEVEATTAEVDRLSRLVDGLLALARAERRSSGATAVPVDLSSFLEDRAGLWRPLAEEQDVALNVDVAGDIRAMATEDGLSQAVDNLVANALEASPPGTAVTLSAGRSGNDITVEVADEGPGMDEAQRSRATDRFWRGRSGSGGSGLGLSIVEKLAAADGGRLELDRTPGGGLAARIHLPAATP